MREGNKIAVSFTSNDDLQAAFEAVVSALPKGWARRRRVEWCLHPIDPDYGDILAKGFIGCTFGMGPA